MNSVSLLLPAWMRRIRYAALLQSLTAFYYSLHIRRKSTTGAGSIAIS
jgi:hypothetical protein